MFKLAETPAEVLASARRQTSAAKKAAEMARYERVKAITNKKWPKRARIKGPVKNFAERVDMHLLLEADTPLTQTSWGEKGKALGTQKVPESHSSMQAKAERARKKAALKAKKAKNYLGAAYKPPSTVAATAVQKAPKAGLMGTTKAFLAKALRKAVKVPV